MKLFGPLAPVAIAGLAFAATMGVTTVPTLAGPAEMQLLESYVGSWTGRGQVTGAKTETVKCNMTLSPGNSGKLNYKGRCAMAGTVISVTGTMAYIDAKRRYEAAMTTNAGFTGVAIGRKSGSAVVFDLREKAEDEDGNDLNITAGIKLTADKIDVDFNVVFISSGDSMKASVPFTK